MADDGKITIKVVADTAKAIAGLEEVRAVGSEMGSAIGSATKAGARMAAAAVATAATAMGAGLASVTKQALDLYAAYEQAAGGIETLFKGSADTVMQNASMAYKTAQMSANEYMELTTSFAASLLQSLGNDTDKAAAYADRAVIDMADNANKMGTSMEMIQNAYQGFAKQNYTMLDNLKLGYGGTKEEMARLIADAAKMTKQQKELGISVDAADMSFGNIVNAISVVQKKLGIAGTSAKEAGSTIEGSVNMARAAWKNWLTGLGNDSADMEQLTGDLVTSLSTAAENIVPRIGTIVGAFAEYGPEAVRALVEAVQDEASGVDLNQAGADILNALANAIRSADISGNMAALLEDIKNALSGQAASPMAQAAASLADALIQEFVSIVSNPGNWGNVATAIGSVLNSLVDSIWNATIGNFGLYLNNGQFSTTRMPTMSQPRGHAVGGVFDTATVLGGRDIVGEAGMELVQPLNKATYEMMGAGIAANLRSEPIDYEAMGRAMCAAVSGMGFYVGDSRLAQATRSSRDRIDGRTAVLARRGVDAG